QRPLEEVARFLGGAESQPVPRPRKGSRKKTRSREAMPVEDVEAELHEEFAEGGPSAETHPPVFRPVTIVSAAEKKQLTLRIEVPVEDMARLGTVAVTQPGPQSGSRPAPAIPTGGSSLADVPSGPAGQSPRASIWSSIHPRLLQ